MSFDLRQTRKNMEDWQNLSWKKSDSKAENCNKPIWNPSYLITFTMRLKEKRWSTTVQSSNETRWSVVSVPSSDIFFLFCKLIKDINNRCMGKKKDSLKYPLPNLSFILMAKLEHIWFQREKFLVISRYYFKEIEWMNEWMNERHY